MMWALWVIATLLVVILTVLVNMDGHLTYLANLAAEREAARRADFSGDR